MKALITLIILVVSVCLTMAAFAGPDNPSAADWVVTNDAALSTRIDKLNAAYASPHMPGAIVAVLKDGQVVHLKGYGFANREFDVPWDPTIRYTFFSVTKSMTASAMLTLEARGSLTLDDEIQKYLTDFPRYDHRITIRHLLTHSSGLHEDEALIHLVGTGAAYSPITLDELYELTKKQSRLSYKPGSYFHYSDTGMRLAARIIEKVTGQSFGEAMRELVFAPAGMKTASIKNYEPRYYPRQASSYALGTPPRPDPSRDAVNVLGIIVETSGDGAVTGSMLDFIQYARFLGANYGQGRSLVERLAQPVYYREGVSGTYRTCVWVGRHRGLKVIQHSGLYGKSFWFIPELNAWVLVMMNAIDSAGPSFDDYGATIIDAILAADSRHTRWLAADNPESATTLGRVRPQSFAPDEIETLVGTWLEPETGFVIRIRHEGRRLIFGLFGNEGDLVHEGSATGAYRTDPGQFAPLLQLRVREGKQLALLFADWPEARPLTRLSVSPEKAGGGLQQYPGLYRSTDYGVVYDIGLRGSNELLLKIGAGARRSDRFVLKHVTGDVFEGTQEAPSSFLKLNVLVRFVREGPRITGLELNADDVHSLEFRRLELIETTAKKQ